MNKISTIFLTQVAKYINTFEEKKRHPAFTSQFETVISVFEYLKINNDKEELNVLDLGCGLGNILFIAKSILGDTHKYVGVDNNQSYLDVAKTVDGQFHLMNTDLLSVPAAMLIANADFVYCYLPMDVCKNMKKLYVLIESAMKSGAYFLCNDKNPPVFNTFQKIKCFEGSGSECCDQTNITIYKTT